MHTVVPRCSVRTKCLLLLVCISLGLIVLHMEMGDNPGLKLIVMSGLADISSHHIQLEDAPSKKSQSWKPSPIFEGVAKLHFIIGLGMFLFIALMVVEDSLMMRALLLVPVVLLFWGSKVLFAIDQANMAADMMRRYRPK